MISHANIGYCFLLELHGSETCNKATASVLRVHTPGARASTGTYYPLATTAGWCFSMLLAQIYECTTEVIAGSLGANIATPVLCPESHYEESISSQSHLLVPFENNCKSVKQIFFDRGGRRPSLGETDSSFSGGGGVSPGLGPGFINFSTDLVSTNFPSDLWERLV